MPLHIWRELNDPPPLLRAKLKTQPLEAATQLYVTCQICQEMGITLEEYRQMPRRDRLTLYYYMVLKGKKEDHAYEENKRKAEMERPPSHPGPHHYR